MNKTKKTISGVGVTTGRIIGTIIQMAPPITAPPTNEKFANNTTTEKETQRLNNAITKTKHQLQQLANNATGQAKEILEATALMAADPTLTNEATQQIHNNKTSAERSIWNATETITNMLNELGGYMAHRVQDIEDVRNRIVAELRNEKAPGIPQSEKPFILTAIDLAPADTATLDPKKILALITSEGGPQSHTAILARQLGIPAIVAATQITNIPNGTEIYLDAAAGKITLNPDETEKKLSETWQKNQKTQEKFSGTCKLADNTNIELLANIGDSKDATAAKKFNVSGVGLLRTEFLFLSSIEEPTIETQIEHYNKIFQQFPQQKIVIRTLDAGADKPLPFLTDESEPNPALGIRGYRTHKTNPNILKNQLQAIAQATKNNKANVWVMAPMISTPTETEEFTKLCKEIGINQAGVMIEVPAAAIDAQQICETADFVSIGTNDLTQYTMAADRQLGTLATLNNSWQPAVLKLIQTTVQGAKKHKKPVGVCGEAAADPALAVILIGLGVNSLSMTPRALYHVNKTLETVTLKQAQNLAQTALNAKNAENAKTTTRQKLPILEELGI